MPSFGRNHIGLAPALQIGQHRVWRSKHKTSYRHLHWSMRDFRTKFSCYKSGQRCQINPAPHLALAERNSSGGGGREEEVHEGSGRLKPGEEGLVSLGTLGTSARQVLYSTTVKIITIRRKSPRGTGQRRREKSSWSEMRTDKNMQGNSRQDTLPRSWS